MVKFIVSFVEKTLVTGVVVAVVDTVFVAFSTLIFVIAVSVSAFVPSKAVAVGVVSG